MKKKKIYEENNMKISTKPFSENLKSITNVIADFVYIDCTDESNYAFYVSTDTQAMKIPLEITDVTDDEKQIYVINKIEFTHLVSYAKEFITLNADYSYTANNGQIKGKFEKNEGYAEELESRKVLFDNEDEYEEFMEVTPSIMNAITSGGIFVAPDSIKPSERFLDIQHSKVFSYSNYKIYMDDIDMEDGKEGLLSNEVLKSIQSLGIGAIVKSNNDSYLCTNAQRSIFEYFSTPNDVDFHPLFSEKFQKKLEESKSFNKISFNIEELRAKLDYLSFYANKNPNKMCYLNIKDDEKFFISTDENTFVEVSAEITKTEEFDEMSVPIDCSAMQLILSKVGKDAETWNMYISNNPSNKLIITTFGDSNETVILAKLNK